VPTRKNFQGEQTNEKISYVGVGGERLVNRRSHPTKEEKLIISFQVTNSKPQNA